jgi:hypothetical protein
VNRPRLQAPEPCVPVISCVEVIPGEPVEGGGQPLAIPQSPLYRLRFAEQAARRRRVPFDPGQKAGAGKGVGACRRRLLRARMAEHGGEPAAPLAVVSPYVPEAPQRQNEVEGLLAGVGTGIVEERLQGEPHVVVLGFQTLVMTRPLGERLPGRLGRHLPEVFPVPCRDGGLIAGLRQALGREAPDRFQKAVAPGARLGNDQRLVGRARPAGRAERLPRGRRCRSRRPRRLRGRTRRRTRKAGTSAVVRQGRAGRSSTRYTRRGSCGAPAPRAGRRRARPSWPGRAAVPMRSCGGAGSGRAPPPARSRAAGRPEGGRFCHVTGPRTARPVWRASLPPAAPKGAASPPGAGGRPASVPPSLCRAPTAEIPPRPPRPARPVLRGWSATIRRFGAARSSDCASVAHDATTCSQLSSTSSSERAASVLRQRLGRGPTRPRSDRQRVGDGAGDQLRVGEGLQVDEPGAVAELIGDFAATWTASRVLPTPPQPVNVTSRCPCSTPSRRGRRPRAR